MFYTRSEFNASLFAENEVNRWKFLEDLEPAQAQEVGYLLRSPVPIVFMTVAYIILVKLIGPWLMSFKKEGFQLKTIIRLYNLIMVLIAGVLLYKLYDAVGSLEAMFDKNKMFTFVDPSATKIYRMSNFILLVRLSEYMDTIFFTLRKKQNQVTFLHVFHHAFVPIYAYWILRTAPCRFNVFIIIVNSFIHVVMYFYYFLATFQERVPTDQLGKRAERKTSFIMSIIKKVLLFKRYLTQMQIMQFITLAFYAMSVIFRQNRCGVPWTYMIANLLLAFGFLGLFLHFYVQSYKKSSSATSRKRQ